MRKTRKNGNSPLSIRTPKNNNNENENENENVWNVPLNNRFNIRQFAPGNNNMYSSSNLSWANRNSAPSIIRRVNARKRSRNNRYNTNRSKTKSKQN